MSMSVSPFKGRKSGCGLRQPVCQTKWPLICVSLRMTEARAAAHNVSIVRGNTDWNPSAYLQSRPPDCPPELRLKWLALCWATRV